ncbi:putative Nuclear receptor corepressor 1 [Glarea lozoyensis 74030]|uniref:Putative Nuclear receptor corepressor 1 n=1 Tax=Glarea lozoyensis (strain ATCC 74030 / MF5533) TaxID=1104152 RepID=H0EEV2_GLAL7|nr:putative Nuclear receptor corepressor 1 [Glarea lozoyensis 74030]
MNVGSRRSSFSPPSWLTLNRSSRNPGYDATESRRSPRDRSPGRYNDPRDADQYRAGFRGNGDRRRSIPDARSSNHGAFQANRELFTEPTRREAARDFPPRDIPRGPKASVGHERSAPHDRSLPHEAPTGPRASQPSHDFRGDSNYRGDFGFRGRGRGRGRGQWLREDSRDRGSREADRGDFRDRDRRPDERGPPPFRDDRGRDRERWDSRDQRDTFRGRRPSSPQGRGRSPNYGSRDTRDPPSNLDLDRTHRAARDAPSSTVSPSGDVIQPFGRGGFGRGRGARGRGRGFYDEYHRPPSIRSRSPEPYNINRRTLQSATPPPQVPAFGSTAAKITTPITPSQIVPPPNAFHTAPTAPATTTSLPPTVPKGPRVPVAPLARQPYAQGLHRPASSTWIRPPDRPSPELRTREDDLFPNYAPTKDDNSNHDNVSNFDNASTHEEVASVNSNAQRKPSSEPQSARSPPREEPPPKKRYPCIGRRQPTIPSPVPEDSDDDDSDSEEELNDNYFEEEIARVKADIAKVEASNPLLPPIVPVIASDWRPFIEPIVDNVIPDPCSTSSAQQEQKVEQPKEPTASVSETEPKITLDDAISPALPPAVEPVTDSAEGNIRSLVTEAVKNEQEDLAQATATNSVVIPESEDVEMADEVTQPPILVAPALPAANEESSSKPTVTSVDAQAGVEPSLSNGHPRPALESAPVSPVNALPIRVDQIAEADEDVKRNDLVANTNGHSAMDLDEPEKPAIPIQPAANGAPVRRLTIEENEGSDGSQDEQEREEELEAVRRMMKTPPLNSLPRSNTGSFWDNVEDHAHLEIRHGRTEKRIKNHIHATEDRRNSVNEAEGRAWAQRYEAYRQFTDFSQDPDAVRSRAQFAASRAKAAAEAAAPHVSSVASASAKPEGRRAHRFATERDFERVLRESEAEAKEKEQDERLARAKTASAKEATIPAMRDAQWWLENGYVDMSHRVPFNRSFALLEYGEPIDNFTPEESETFEKVYLETPKNWSRVAEALDHRDFKACIQHYYLVKHSAKLKEKASSKKKKKGRGPAKKRQTTAMSAMVENNDNAEDDQENETGGSKRRPRRAAAPTFPIDAHAAAPNESESGTPVPTPGRKSATVPKSENGSEAGPAKKKVKVARESKKQSKNNPLLAAAPMAAAARRDDSPITPVPPPIPLEAKLARNNVSQSRFPPQFDGPSSTGQAIQPQPAFAPLVSSSFIPSPAPIERQAPSMTGTFEIMPQPHLSPQPQTPQQQPLSYPSQERVGSMTPLSFDTNQASRNIQQTSSYWSVPEQNDFPALLRHFGSDWQGIAKHMTSKTHIMVYTNLFQQWLQVPSDSNKSRRVANIQTQVKNFYQRRVDNGQRDWEEMVKEADAKRERGESTGLAPTPSIIPKRRYDPTGSLPPRSGSAMDGVEGVSSTSPAHPNTISCSCDGWPRTSYSAGSSGFYY